MRKLFGKCRCTAGETLTAREESGQAVVEFALAFPLLLLILCGILDFGWIYMNQYRIEYAAFTGARYAGIHAPDSDDDEALELAVASCVEENLPSVGDGTVAVTLDGAGKEVTITVDYPVPTLTFVAGTIVGQTDPAHAEKTTGF